ncbi:MAG TPA: glycosyltransferase family 39 protein [Opitutaceae bacterium]|nr:glycosyltransferase family 39 protein [Opitutaceae bacterium]
MNSSSILPLAIFLLDAGVVALIAAFVAAASGHARHGPLEAFVAWMWTGVALIVAAGIVLGETGLLRGAGGFLALHALFAAGFGAARRNRWRDDAAALRAVLRQAREFFRTPGADRAWAVALLAIVALLLLLAAGAAPVIYDGLSYRLPRIAAWWQSGRIELLATTDARLNYMPVAPDLVIGWLLTATTHGFRLVALAQAAGGVLTIAATIGLARETGLERRAALLAGFLLLGMANVVAQFTSTQTDLFTTGVLAAAFFLWLRALRRGEASWCGALGLGLAIAAKGTVFYLAPGAVLWIAWLAWRHPPGARATRRMISAAVVGVAFFSGFGFFRNARAYGGIFGPADFVRMHQRLPDSPADLAQKLGRNLLATLAQLFEPNSQPFGLRESGRRVGAALAARLPTEDHDAFEPRGRRITLEQIMARDEPDADVTSCGVLAAILFLVGIVVALRRRRGRGEREDPAAPLVLVWSAGLIAFVVFLSAIQQWHGYGFRFLVLAAPWMAVVGAWGVEQLRRGWRVASWSLALAASASTAWFVLGHTHQIGWRAIVQPERSLGYFVFENWRAWSRTLAPETEPLRVALPMNVPLAAFYRQPNARALALAPEPVAPTAEAATPADGGWLVVTASRFVGREGDVAARAWLFRGDETSPFSVVAYRRRRAGEKSAPLFYRNIVTAAGGETTFDLWVKTWTAEPTRFRLINPAPTRRAYVLFTPLGRSEGSIDAGASVALVLPLPENSVSAMKLVVGAPADPAAAAPRFELDLP